MNPLERRFCALKDLLALDKPTSKAKPYSEWASPPQVNVETEEADIYYKKLFKEKIELLKQLKEEDISLYNGSQTDCESKETK